MTEQTELETRVPSARKGGHDGVRNELSVFLKVKPGHEQQIRAILSGYSKAPDSPQRKPLADVGTLHEARQVLFDDDTRLLIATSFDGDWDVYIDDFARTHVLDDWHAFLVHCEGYPDEGQPPPSLFEKKEFLTAHQVTAAAYFGTYPDVTVKQIVKSLRLQSLFQALLDEASS